MEQFCPCGQARHLSACCGRYLDGSMQPLTAEQLMRSRYVAFALGRALYLRETLLPSRQKGFDLADTEAWIAQTRWLGLTILEVQAGGPNEVSGTVTFEARFEHRGEVHEMREKSQFKKRDGRWYYVKALA